MSTEHDHTSPSIDPQPIPGPFAPLVRAPFQLRSLSLEYRWEVTRRHPYYLRWWESAKAHCNGQPCSHPVEHHLRQIAVTVLGLIGVSGEPVHPATTFEELMADETSRAWLSGAVHPITFRGLTGLLITSLPKETLATLGWWLMQASCEDQPDGPPNKTVVLTELAKEQRPGLESFPQEPLVSINPAASRRRITEDLAALLIDWKGERQLSETRDRSDKYVDYLRVWDLREGWTGKDYDFAQERKLREVAAETGLPIPTVSKYYRSAFEMIVGHPYSPEVWLRVFGPYKIFCNKELGPVSRHRPLQSRTRRDVPESVLCTNSTSDESASILSRVADQNTGFEHVEIVLDIQTLLEKGKSDEEIVDELELNPAAVTVIQYLRNRNTDHTKNVSQA